MRGIIPITVQDYIWDNCYASASSGLQDFVPCQPPVDGALATAVVEQIRNEDVLMNELRYWMSTMKVASLIGRDRATSAKELRAKVDAAIGGNRNHSQ